MNPIESLMVLIGLILVCLFIHFVIKIQDLISSLDAPSTKNTISVSNPTIEPSKKYKEFDLNFRWYFLLFLAIFIETCLSGMNSSTKFAEIVLHSLRIAGLNFILFFLFAIFFLSERNLWFLSFVYCLFYSLSELFIPWVLAFYEVLPSSTLSICKFHIGIFVILLGGNIFYPNFIRLKNIIDEHLISVGNTFLFILGFVGIALLSYSFLIQSNTDIFELFSLGIWSGIFSSIVFISVYYFWGKLIPRDIGILTSFVSGFTAAQFQSLSVTFAAMLLFIFALALIISFTFYFLVHKRFSPLWVNLLLFAGLGIFSYLVQPWMELGSLTNFDGVEPFTKRLNEVFFIGTIYAICLWSIVGLGILIDKIRR
ncbi:MAG: hypothetical protein MH321_11970 [Leptospiraceae bacterium]|nr:hypothetical protein [Leptospiraceae bacterium]